MKKNNRLNFRCTGETERRLKAICVVEKKKKTAVLTDLIEEKFKSNGLYIQEYLYQKSLEK